MAPRAGLRLTIEARGGRLRPCQPSFAPSYAGNIAGLLADRPRTAGLFTLLATAPLMLGVAGLGLSAGALVRETRSRFKDPANAVLLAIMAFALLADGTACAIGVRPGIPRG